MFTFWLLGCAYTHHATM